MSRSHGRRRRGHDGDSPLDQRTTRSRPTQRRAAAAAGRGGSRLPRGERVTHGWTPGTEPRGRGTHHRASSRLRLAPGSVRVRHRPSVLRPQDAHRQAGLRRLEITWRPRGLPAACGERARRRGVLARVELAELGRRDLPRADPHRPGRPARRRHRRRRIADRRNDLGGAQQHLRRQRPTPRDRRQ